MVAVDTGSGYFCPPPTTLPLGNEPPDPIWYKLVCAHRSYGRFGEEVFWPLSGTERLIVQPTAEVLHRLSHPGSDDNDDDFDDNHNNNNNNTSTNSLFQSECYSLLCTAVSDISRLLHDCCWDLFISAQVLLALHLSAVTSKIRVIAACYWQLASTALCTSHPEQRHAACGHAKCQFCRSRCNVAIPDQ